MSIPIVLTAFGTTAKAFETYDRMDEIFRERFKDHPLIWAFSSRMVKDRIKKNRQRDISDPLEVLDSLNTRGCEWAVVQSLHLICGHEFYRLVAQAGQSPVRTSMGLPLLTSAEDYMETSDVLAPLIPPSKEEAVVFVGHGTDHPAWTSYPGLEQILRKKYGNNVFSGVVEGYPEMEATIDRIQQNGFKHITLVPFMLVAGVHFKEDLTEEEDSWKKTFEKNNITVSIVDHGIGQIKGITEIFCRHIKEALDVIPDNTGSHP
ncbi:MAG: sirohydrochlorin cobaltochelatase [Desulfobacteraceae bacterium]